VAKIAEQQEGNMDDLPMPSGRQVRSVRNYFGMSQGKFSQLAGINISTLVKLEKGMKVDGGTMEMVARQVARMEVAFRKDGSMVLPL
jgi:DNA-binding XRE family transcriptional regulator